MSVQVKVSIRCQPAETHSWAGFNFVKATKSGGREE